MTWERQRGEVGEEPRHEGGEGKGRGRRAGGGGTSGDKNDGGERGQGLWRKVIPGKWGAAGCWWCFPTTATALLL